MRKLAIFPVVLIGACLSIGPVCAQGMDFSQATEQTVPLGHSLYAVIASNPDKRSGIGNTTVAVGRDGIIVVDPQFDQTFPLLKARIAALSPLPVRYVIDTHFHGDHTGGNAAFARGGAVVVGQDNVLKRLSMAKTPLPKEALPTQTYSDKYQVKVGGQIADLVHVANAHTDGDTVIFWRAADVIDTGDIVHSHSYPNIDATGGGIDGEISGVNYILANSDANAKFVPGHDAVTDRAGVIAYRNMLVTARDRIAKAKASGMSEDQVVSANLLADLDKYWKIPGSGSSERFPRSVYQTLR